MTTTAQQIIDRALSRSSDFQSRYNEGAALAYLDEKQKQFLLDLGRTAEGLVGDTINIETLSGADALVAIDALGVPYFTTTFETGYAISFAGAVPYINTDTPFIDDPFGEDGDSPGLPLPANLLRLCFVTVRTDTTQAPSPPLRVEVLNQEVAYRQTLRTGLQAFLSAARLIPLRLATGDLWSQVTSVQIGCIVCPTLTTLASNLVVPDAVLPALTAALVRFFAGQTPKMSQGDKRAAREDAENEYRQMVDSINSMDAITTSTIIFRR